VSPGSEVALTFEDEQREDILKSLFGTYYQRNADKDIIFDINRVRLASRPAGYWARC